MIKSWCRKTAIDVKYTPQTKGERSERQTESERIIDHPECFFFFFSDRTWLGLQGIVKLTYSTTGAKSHGSSRYHELSKRKSLLNVLPTTKVLWRRDQVQKKKEKRVASFAARFKQLYTTTTSSKNPEKAWCLLYAPTLWTYYNK